MISKTLMFDDIRPNLFSKRTICRLDMNLLATKIRQHRNAWRLGTRLSIWKILKKCIYESSMCIFSPPFSAQASEDQLPLDTPHGLSSWSHDSARRLGGLSWSRDSVCVFLGSPLMGKHHPRSNIGKQHENISGFSDHRIPKKKSCDYGDHVNANRFH